VSEALRPYREPILEELHKAVPAQGPLSILVRYPLGLVDASGRPGPGVGGKLLRPSLACLSCEALGAPVENAVPLAAALELVHVFSLVHDDIQDGDELRRGRPTAWKTFGTAQAINAGDALLTLALRTANRAPLNDTLLTAAAEALLGGTQRMIEGQVLDIELQQQGGETPAYLDMARLKTGALLGCALELGAVAADRGEWATAHRQAGEELGLAFQIQDDMLGLWGNPANTGKPVGSDLQRGKHTFPLALASQEDPDIGRALRRRPVDMDRVMHWLEEMGIRERCAAEAGRRLDAVQAAMGMLPWSEECRRSFAELVDTLVAREA